MAKTTITEALADIKTSQARIMKKQQSVLLYLSRDAKLRDPMEKEGGSAEFVRKERQSIHDLQEKIVRMRSAIQAENLKTELTIEGTKRTISEWLNWRREIATHYEAFLSSMADKLARTRQQAAQLGMHVKDDANAAAAGDIVVNVSEAALAAEIEQAANVLGQLDGKLSLLNATMFIEI